MAVLPMPGAGAWLRWLAAAGSACAVLALASLAAPAVPVAPTSAYAIGFAVIGATVLGCAFTAPRVRRRHVWLVLAPLAMLTVVRLSDTSGLAAALPVTASLLLGGTLIGGLVASEVQHVGYLVFVAVVSSAVDLVSVFHPSGVSAAISQSPAALSVVALPWPMLGTGAIEPYLGVGDVVFSAVYAGACRIHGLPVRRTLTALAVGFACTLVLVLLLEQPVPALPLLGAAIVSAHPETRRPPVADRKRGTVGALLIVALCAAVFLTRT